jgi:outer membrane protein assembly factor BamA
MYGYEIVDDIALKSMKKYSKTSLLGKHYKTKAMQDLPEQDKFTEFIRSLTYEQLVKYYTILYISGELFLDAGSTLGSQNQVPGNPGRLLLKPGQGFSVGTGVIVTTPVGPLRLEVASQDFSGNWRFNVGVGFKF